MTYQQALDFLFGQLPMYQRVGTVAVKKDLKNIRALLKHLDNPHQTFRSIHIAGTNGKGSVAHMLAACYQSARLKVGLYTSPHYVDFRERIKIDGQLIPKRSVVQFVIRNQEVIAQIHPSFFEMSVAMAFEYFALQQVDVAIVETGLGGRLDSTNVLRPLCSVITNIGFDHQKMLGDTLPKIAREKAGIIKSATALIIGKYQQKTAPVFRRVADLRAAPMYYANRTLRCVQKKPSLELLRCDIYYGKRLYYGNLKVQAGGAYQYENVVTAIMTAKVVGDIYPGLRLSKASVRRAMENLQTLTRFQGRWQVLSKNPLTIADSAHNTDGLRQVLKQIKSLPIKGRQHFVLGVVNDKDLSTMLPLFPSKARYYFACPAVPRGLSATVLQREAAHYGLFGKAYTSVRRAIRAARMLAAKEDFIYIGGSTFVVAESI